MSEVEEGHSCEEKILEWILFKETYSVLLYNSKECGLWWNSEPDKTTIAEWMTEIETKITKSDKLHVEKGKKLLETFA